MPNYEETGKIASRIDMLSMIQEAGQLALITLVANPELEATYYYHGLVLNIDELADEPVVDISVDKAFVVLETEESQARTELFKALREAREAILPSPNTAAALAADLALGSLLDENDPEINEIILDYEVGKPKTIKVKDIDTVMGLSRRE